MNELMMVESALVFFDMPAVMNTIEMMMSVRQIRKTWTRIDFFSLSIWTICFIFLSKVHTDILYKMNWLKSLIRAENIDMDIGLDFTRHSAIYEASKVRPDILDAFVHTDFLWTNKPPNRNRR